VSSHTAHSPGYLEFGGVVVCSEPRKHMMEQQRGEVVEQ